MSFCSFRSFCNLSNTQTETYCCAKSRPSQARRLLCREGGLLEGGLRLRGDAEIDPGEELHDPGLRWHHQGRWFCFLVSLSFTPFISNSRQVCVSLNHGKGSGCQRSCHFDHKCMFCGEGGHGLWQSTSKGGRVCRAFEAFEKEYEKFVQRHFSLRGREEDLAAFLAREMRPKPRVAAMAPPPAGRPPPPPAAPPTPSAADMGLRSKAAPSVPQRSPDEVPPPFDPPSPPPGLSFYPCGARGALPTVPLKAPPPLCAPYAVPSQLPGTFAPPPGLLPCSAAPFKAPPACKAPPTTPSSSCMGAALIDVFREKLHEARIPEECRVRALQWVLEEQAVEVSEVLEHLEEIAEIAGIRRLPLQRLRVCLASE